MPADIPFNREMTFEYGRMDALSPLVRRVIAPNPGAFTFHGTGTYVLGRGNVAVIDPGPLIDEHVAAIQKGLAGETVSHILITHTHRDHSPAAAPLKAATGAPTYGFGPHGGASPDGGEVEEGGDRDFVPDHVVKDGDVIEGDGWSVECLHTPGHTSNHICFQLREEKALFCGDHVMGWSTTIVSPPDGNMSDYVASLERLLKRDDVRYWPTHGTSIEDPKAFVRALIAHREERADQVLACLKDGIDTIEAMVPVMYAGDVPPAMFPAAARSVFSTVAWLVDRGEIAAEGKPGIDQRYRLV
jgi:glyoxylase-like metal-dependent hydrolase (beta-lactamase superfamily II)